MQCFIELYKPKINVRMIQSSGRDYEKLVSDIALTLSLSGLLMHLNHLHCSAFHFTKLREQLASPVAWKALLTFLLAIFLLIGCP